MALVERIQKTTDATFWPGKIPMNYIYTAGRAGELFFNAIKEKGQFLGAKCNRCNQVYLPPRIYCPQCFERIEENFITVENQGVVHTFCICHEGFDGKPKDKPSIVAAIKLDGADGLFFHRIEGIDAKDCRIGMRVEAVFKPKTKREGSILDITHFKAV